MQYSVQVGTSCFLLYVCLVDCVCKKHCSSPSLLQLWDLRFATAPMRILEQHKRGVLSIAWCPQDSDLLLSAAKDNQVLCWNPNSEQAGGEVGVVSLSYGCGYFVDVCQCLSNREENATV